MSVNKKSSDTLTDGIHKQIVQYLAEKFPNISGFSDVDDYHKCMVLFSNFRIKHGTPVGLKLTTTGKSLLGKHFTKYEFSLNEILSPKVLLALDRNMSWPYYVNGQRIIFYSQQDAAWFKLSGGELHSYIECI
jgi:hypothetical protein